MRTGEPTSARLRTTGRLPSRSLRFPLRGAAGCAWRWTYRVASRDSSVPFWPCWAGHSRPANQGWPRENAPLRSPRSSLGSRLPLPRSLYASASTQHPSRGRNVCTLSRNLSCTVSMNATSRLKSGTAHFPILPKFPGHHVRYLVAPPTRSGFARSGALDRLITRSVSKFRRQRAATPLVSPHSVLTVPLARATAGDRAR